MAVGGHSQLCRQTKLHLCCFPGNLLPIMACIQPIFKLYSFILCACVWAPKCHGVYMKARRQLGYLVFFFYRVDPGIKLRLSDWQPSQWAMVFLVTKPSPSLESPFLGRHCIQSSNHKACIRGKIFAKNKYYC